MGMLSRADRWTAPYAKNSMAYCGRGKRFAINYRMDKWIPRATRYLFTEGARIMVMSEGKGYTGSGFRYETYKTFGYCVQQLGNLHAINTQGFVSAEDINKHEFKFLLLKATCTKLIEKLVSIEREINERV